MYFESWRIERWKIEKKERQDSSKEKEKRAIVKEKEDNKSGAVFINYINFIITNIKFKICTYCKYVNISCGLKRNDFYKHTWLNNTNFLLKKSSIYYN
jgi:hypothetical protein